MPEKTPMNLAKAYEILGDIIQKDKSLVNRNSNFPSRYLNWEFNYDCVSIGSNFTFQELAAIMWWISNHTTKPVRIKHLDKLNDFMGKLIEPPKKKVLKELLEEWSVLTPNQWENDKGPEGWYAVCNDDDGIIAYFKEEKKAYSFRLSEINKILNG